VIYAFCNLANYYKNLIRNLLTGVAHSPVSAITKMTKNSKHTKQNKSKKTISKSVKKIASKAKPKQQHRTSNGGLSFGQRAGQFLGGHMQNAIAKITGLGDYRVSGAGGIRNDNGPPQFAPGRTPRIAHREYLGDITSSIDFTANTYDLNPGNPTTFPWLAQIAKKF
jgi:hypothetical protein